MARCAVSAARPPTRPAAALQTTDVDRRRRRRPTPTTVTSLVPYTMCRRASNKLSDSHNMNVCVRRSTAISNPQAVHVRIVAYAVVHVVAQNIHFLFVDNPIKIN